jgi:hypothetical protein
VLAAVAWSTRVSSRFSCLLSVEVVVVLWHVGERLGEDLVSTDTESLLAKVAFETFLAPLERLEYGLGT